MLNPILILLLDLEKKMACKMAARVILLMWEQESDKKGTDAFILSSLPAYPCLY